MFARKNREDGQHRMKREIYIR